MVSIRTRFTLFLSSTFIPSFSKAQSLHRRFAFVGFTTGVAAFSTFSTSSHPRIQSPSTTFTEAKEQTTYTSLHTVPSRSSSQNSQQSLSMLSSQDENSFDLGYLTAKAAYDLDQELMSQPGFSLEQLMELAGFSVAEAGYQMLSSKSANIIQTKKSILIFAGPGNNGGDGLVAARHLYHFGFDCTVIYPKRSKGNHFVNLVSQCENLGIRVLDEIPTDEDDIESMLHYDLLIDALFGFSFKGEPREPLAALLRKMIHLVKVHNIPILSVDIPSGWHVENGNVREEDDPYSFEPVALISLTAPKECSRYYKGRHFVGGRFLPDFLAEKYHIRMPPYKGTAQIYELHAGKLDSDPSTNAKGSDESDKNTSSEQGDESNEDWAKEYQNYLNEKYKEEQNDDSSKVEKNIKEKENNVEGEEDWAVAYSKYCIEKEIILAENDRLKLEKQRKELQ